MNNNDKLMMKSESQYMAEQHLSQKVEERLAKDSKLTREEVERHAQRIGYKSDIDKKIVDSVCEKFNLRSNRREFEQKRKVCYNRQSYIHQLSNQGIINAQEENRIEELKKKDRRIHKKYY